MWRKYFHLRSWNQLVFDISDWLIVTNSSSNCLIMTTCTFESFMFSTFASSLRSLPTGLSHPRERGKPIMLWMPTSEKLCESVSPKHPRYGQIALYSPSGFKALMQQNVQSHWGGMLSCSWHNICLFDFPRLLVLPSSPMSRTSSSSLRVFLSF